jgi:hypothetical protein
VAGLGIIASIISSPRFLRFRLPQDEPRGPKLEIFFSGIVAASWERLHRDTKDPGRARSILFFRGLTPQTRINWHSRRRYSAEPNSPFGILWVTPRRTGVYLQCNGDEHIRLSPKRRLTMKQLSKLALLGALLVATVSAASAQGFSGSHDNSQDFYSQQQNVPADEPNKTDVGEGAGGA